MCIGLEYVLIALYSMVVRVEIDGKWFLVRWTGMLDRSLISIREQVRGRSFWGFITKECGTWLVAEQRKLVVS